MSPKPAPQSNQTLNKPIEISKVANDPTPKTIEDSPKSTTNQLDFQQTVAENKPLNARKNESHSTGHQSVNFNGGGGFIKNAWHKFHHLFKMYGKATVSVHLIQNALWFGGIFWFAK